LAAFGLATLAGAAAAFFAGVATFLAALGALDGVVDFGLAVLTRGFLTAPVAFGFFSFFVVAFLGVAVVVFFTVFFSCFLFLL